MKVKIFALIVFVTYIFIFNFDVKAAPLQHTLVGSNENIEECLYEYSGYTVKINFNNKIHPLSGYSSYIDHPLFACSTSGAYLNISPNVKLKVCPYSVNIDPVRSPCDIVVGTKTSCGNITMIPKKIPELTSFAITAIQIAVPILLVIMGTLDLFKGITAGKEDEMKKGQQMFIKRLVVGALIFFVVVIVKFVISIIANAVNSANIVDCIDCFISNNCN